MHSNNLIKLDRRRAISTGLQAAASGFVLLMMLALLLLGAAPTHAAIDTEPDPANAGPELTDLTAAPETPGEGYYARVGVATIPEFTHYQPIIDRKPFGVAPPPPAAAVTPPPADNTAAMAAKQEQELAKRIGMCAVNITPGGTTAVGFIDNSQKPPRNYYLTVGESADGFKLTAGNYKEETATLEKDGITITLKLGQGLVPAGGKTAATASPVGSKVPPTASHSAAVVAPRLPVSTPPPVARTLTGRPVPPPPKEGEQESYADRLRRRREELLRERMESYLTIKSQAEQDAEAKNAEVIRAEAERVLRAKNLELIRQGQPALPIQLTAEEDEQLVNEGVLQPAGQAPIPAPEDAEAE